MSNYLFGSDESEVMAEFLKIAKEEKLYDVEPSEDKTGKELVEKAHPEKETVEVTKTYNVDTGVVENENQQQEVDIDVALKMPDNHVSRKTMAELNLQDELTLIADEMKVRGEKDLEAFAKRLNNSFKKKAAAPLVIGALIAIPTLIGGYLASVHLTDPVDYGVSTNLDSVWYAIQEYKQNKIENFGLKDNSNVVVILDEIEKCCIGIVKTRENYINAINYLSQNLKNVPQTKSDLKNIDPEEVKETIKDPHSAKTAKLMNKYTKMYNSYIKSKIPKLMSNYKYLQHHFESSSELASSETGQRSTLEQLWEKTKEFGEYFEKTDEQHVLDSLEVAIKSLSDDVKNRELEVKQIISALSAPIEEDISKNFDIEEVKKELTEKETDKV